MGLVHDFNTELGLWFNEHGVPNLDFVEGEDFCFYPNSACAQWGVFEDPRTDSYFEQFLLEYGLRYVNISPFVLSLIHEVGHYMTLSNFKESEWDSELALKKSRLSDGSIDDHYWYWELPTEFAANMWAINWINTHFEEVCELEELCAGWVGEILADDDINRTIVEWRISVMMGSYEPLWLEEPAE